MNFNLAHSFNFFFLLLSSSLSLSYHFSRLGIYSRIFLCLWFTNYFGKCKERSYLFYLKHLHPGLKDTVKATRTVILNTGEHSGNSRYTYWGVLLACHGQKAGQLNVLEYMGQFLTREDCSMSQQPLMQVKNSVMII